jgi:hypothetical protein
MLHTCICCMWMVKRGRIESSNGTQDKADRSHSFQSRPSKAHSACLMERINCTSFPGSLLKRKGNDYH